MATDETGVVVPRLRSLTEAPDRPVPADQAWPTTVSPEHDDDRHEAGGESLVAPAKRKPLLAFLAAFVFVAAVGCAAYWLVCVKDHVTTENAYVGADVAQVAPLDAGTIRQMLVEETETVTTGQILVTLDDADAKVALAAAEANLAGAERKVVGYRATDRSLAAQIAARSADQARSRAALEATKAKLNKAMLDLARRKALLDRGFISREQVELSANAVTVAQADYDAAEAVRNGAKANHDAAAGALAANAALTQGVPLRDTPDIRAAQALVDRARLQLSRTIIRAPIAGIAARRDGQIGQRVAAGERLMQIVPLDRVYVDANFKESQLRRVRPGQPVALTADLYGSAVRYHGRVLGLSGGTGAAFALIPTQNATGNWIKVVQRVSVRIRLDPRELAAKPLRLGLSMRADIDTRAPGVR